MNLYSNFQMPENGSELSEILLDENVTIERIISTGQITPPDYWYDQARDEWVSLLQGNAVIQFKYGEEIRLKAGDQLLIPHNLLHRVVFTSVSPPCIWIAIHGNLLSGND